MGAISRCWTSRPHSSFVETGRLRAVEEDQESPGLERAVLSEKRDEKGEQSSCCQPHDDLFISCWTPVARGSGCAALGCDAYTNFHVAFHRRSRRIAFRFGPGDLAHSSPEFS